MSKFEEAVNRMFSRVFVCRNCKSKLRTDMQKILKKEVTCRKCGCKAFRPVKKTK